MIFFIQRFVYRKLWNKNLDVSISFDREILYEDENNVLKEIITNRKYLPLPILQVKFSITRTFLFERQENTKVTDRYYRNEFFTVMPLQKITSSHLVGETDFPEDEMLVMTIPYETAWFLLYGCEDDRYQGS